MSWVAVGAFFMCSAIEARALAVNAYRGHSFSGHIVWLAVWVTATFAMLVIGGQP